MINIQLVISSCLSVYFGTSSCFYVILFFYLMVFFITNQASMRHYVTFHHPVYLCCEVSCLPTKLRHFRISFMLAAQRLTD